MSDESAFIARLDDVSKHYGAGWVLKKVSFSISSSEICLVTGSNGSGKSTLLKVISGLSKPDRGQVKSEVRKSYLGAEDALYKELTLGENLELFSTLEQQCFDKALGLAKAFGITGFLDKRFSELSSGIKKKATIVRTFLAQAELLILDEPLNFLDQEGIKTLTELIQLKQSIGVAFVIASNRGESFQPLEATHYCLSQGELLPKTEAQ